MDKQLHLTAGERLVLARRRRGALQSEIARELGMSRSAYKEVELDQSSAEHFDIPEVGELEPHEFCYIARRRAGVTQQQIAEALGRSRLWVGMMELGKVGSRELYDYWTGQYDRSHQVSSEVES